MIASSHARLFVETACPLCASRSYSVVLPSRFPVGMLPQDVLRFYSASSDADLLDQLVRCSGCELVYVNPRLDERLIADAYGSAVDPVFVAQNPERIRTFSRVLQNVARELRLEPSRQHRVLDVGCAGGAFLKAAKDLGYSAQGVEPSRWMADFGRNEYGVDIRDGRLEPGMFPPASFDMVTLWDVIEHVPEPLRLLGTIREILKPGGVLLVSFPDFGSLVARLMGRRWPFLLSVHLLYYTRQTISRQLTDAGFEVLRIHPHWQILQLGYVLQRASQVVKPLGLLRTLVNAVGLGHVPVTYTLGQSFVIAKRR